MAEEQEGHPSREVRATTSTHTDQNHESGGVGDGVYARYPIYDERGWTNSLWMRPGTKWPPPEGFTGYEGKESTAEQKDWWAQCGDDRKQGPNGNIAQRMPYVFCETEEWVIIGIDVDDYEAKRGGQTLANAEELWGKLPPTYVSTSRDDGISGIRFYRAPKGTKLKSLISFPELGLGDIELIQRHHRYAVSWPSIHPEGRLYLWRWSEGWSVLDLPPYVTDIPPLPATWLEGLKEGAKTRSKTKGRVTDGTAWVECPYIIEQCLTEGEMSQKVKVRLADAVTHCYGGSRHDQTLKHSLALLRFGRRGESGVFEAMSALMKTFVNAVTADGSRTEQEAKDEFMRMLSNKGAAERLSKPDDDEPPPYGSIDGAAVLDKVEAWFRRFIRVTFDHDYHLLALWTVHTHLAVECHTTPRLQLDSLVEGAGKTTVLDHFKRLCQDPVLIASLSSPALLPRILHNGMRTILLDEVHRTLNSDKPGIGDLVAIINTGYRLGATRPVNVPVKGGGWEVVDMPTFAPAALAGNDPNLENDTRSRMIRVLLMPDFDGSVEDSDWEYLEDEAAALQEEIALWASSARETVKGMRVDLPIGCIGRSKEKWRPIKRIAVAAGGRWETIADDLIENGLEEEAAAREAGLKKQPPGMVLLIDLFAVWPKGKDFMPTQELVDLLVAHNPGYWGSESTYGRRLTETRLGLLLNQATNSTSTRPDSHGHRGYTLSAIQFAWARLRIGQFDRDTPSTNPENPANPANPEQESDESRRDCSGSAESAECSGLNETPTSSNQHGDVDQHGPPCAGQRTDVCDFNALRVELGVPTSGQIPNNNGHAASTNGNGKRRDPVWMAGICAHCDDRSGSVLIDKETGRCTKCWADHEDISR